MKHSLWNSNVLKIKNKIIIGHTKVVNCISVEFKMYGIVNETFITILKLNSWYKCPYGWAATAHYISKSACVCCILLLFELWVLSFSLFYFTPSNHGDYLLNTLLWIAHTCRNIQQSHQVTVWLSIWTLYCHMAIVPFPLLASYTFRTSCASWSYLRS